MPRPRSCYTRPYLDCKIGSVDLPPLFVQLVLPELEEPAGDERRVEPQVEEARPALVERHTHVARQLKSYEMSDKYVTYHNDIM
jgi:hypothetical protein